MTDFAASNGCTFSEFEEYVKVTAQHGGILVGSGSVGVDLKEYVNHLRATFEAEADERLGRWRWPEEPDYVVYPAANGCLVLLELTGDTFFLHRDFLDGEDEPTRAARAYFDAHPRPEPLPDKPGLYTGAHIGGQPSVWWRHGDGSWLLVNNNARYIGAELRDIEKYAPFTRHMPEMAP